MQITQATKITLLLLSMVTVMSNVAIITSLPQRGVINIWGCKVPLRP